MSSQDTLLAHLVPKLTSQVEDAATEALAFILNKSEDCRGALVELLKKAGLTLKALDRFSTQVTYEDGSIPDLVGYDKEGDGRLLVEVKFWAGLTDRQPNAYLANLPSDGPAGLLFIVPGVRLGWLWSEVKERATEGNYELGAIFKSGPLRSVALEGLDHHMLMTSWSHLLDVLLQKVPADDSDTRFEISQLRGLADNMDADAFLPLQDGELDSAVPRRMLGLMRLVDETVKETKAHVSVSNQRSLVPKGGGYGYSFYLNGKKVWFGILLRKWARYGTTPLWVWPFEQTARNRLYNQHRKSPDGDHFPVDLSIGADYDAVLKQTVSQLEKMGRILKGDPGESTSEGP